MRSGQSLCSLCLPAHTQIRPTNKAQGRGQASVSCPVVPCTSGNWPSPQHSVRARGALTGTGQASLMCQGQGLYHSYFSHSAHHSAFAPEEELSLQEI